MRTFNGKVADDSVSIKDHQVQNGWGSTAAPDLFAHICRIIGDDIFTIHRNLWGNYILSKNRRGWYWKLCKKAIRNILHTNIDVHSIILIAEFPMDGIKCNEKFQSHCANITFSDKSRYDRNFQ